MIVELMFGSLQHTESGEIAETFTCSNLFVFFIVLVLLFDVEEFSRPSVFTIVTCGSVGSFLFGRGVGGDVVGIIPNARVFSETRARARRSFLGLFMFVNVLFGEFARIIESSSFPSFVFDLAKRLQSFFVRYCI